jgi:uncharacterized protein (TIGR02466 family)
MKRVELFTTKIYQDFLEDTSELDQLLNYCCFVWSETNNNYSVSNRNGFQSDKNLHLDSDLKKLNEYIKQIFIAILSEYNIHAKPIINSMWVNINKKHGFNHLHIHSDCWYSGILFVDWGTNSGDLMLVDPRPGMELNDYHQKINPNSNVVIHPKTGDLILFPAWLPHLIEPNQNDIPAFCISFNVELDFNV